MNTTANGSKEVPAALALRINSVLQSREFEFGIAITALRAANPATTGNPNNGRIFGPHARAELTSVLVLLAQDYLQYCKDESIDPATHINALAEAIERYGSAVKALYTKNITNAFAPNGDPGNVQLYNQYVDQFLIEGKATLAGVAMGRMHGKLFYRYRHPALAFVGKHIIPIVVTIAVAAITAVVSTSATNAVFKSASPATSPTNATSAGK